MLTTADVFVELVYSTVEAIDSGTGVIVVLLIMGVGRD